MRIVAGAVRRIRAQGGGVPGGSRRCQALPESLLLLCDVVAAALRIRLSLCHHRPQLLIFRLQALYVRGFVRFQPSQLCLRVHGMERRLLTQAVKTADMANIAVTVQVGHKFTLVNRALNGRGSAYI